MEIRQGPERRSHDIEAGWIMMNHLSTDAESFASSAHDVTSWEAGSMVLAAIVIGEGQSSILESKNLSVWVS